MEFGESDQWLIGRIDIDSNNDEGLVFNDDDSFMEEGVAKVSGVDEGSYHSRVGSPWRHVQGLLL